jgi:hypothetical protein
LARLVQPRVDEADCRLAGEHLQPFDVLRRRRAHRAEPRRIEAEHPDALFRGDQRNEEDGLQARRVHASGVEPPVFMPHVGDELDLATAEDQPRDARAGRDLHAPVHVRAAAAEQRRAEHVGVRIVQHDPARRGAEHPFDAAQDRVAHAFDVERGGQPPDRGEQVVLQFRG